MERRYKKVDYINKYNQEVKSLVKGLKIVHIGKDVWKVGRTNYVKDPNSTELEKDKHGKMVPKRIAHCVIYGPNRKEYHVYGKEIDLLTTTFDKTDHYRATDRDGNIKIESSLKIYILTHILDDRKNWCFDLKSIPPTGKLKVIYNNGTIKNIDFDGEFKKETIMKNYYTNVDEKTNWEPWETLIWPLAYRIK